MRWLTSRLGVEGRVYRGRQERDRASEQGDIMNVIGEGRDHEAMSAPAPSGEAVRGP